MVSQEEILASEAYRHLVPDWNAPVMLVAGNGEWIEAHPKA